MRETAGITSELDVLVYGDAKLNHTFSKVNKKLSNVHLSLSNVIAADARTRRKMARDLLVRARTFYRCFCPFCTCNRSSRQVGCALSLLRVFCVPRSPVRCRPRVPL